MLFNSFEFLLFFPTVCIIYYLLPSLKLRNMFLLLASYYFYMSWKPIYAILILGSTIITYLCALYVDSNKSHNLRKWTMIISLFINFGILFLFKYYNFINDSMFALMESIGLNWRVPNLDLLLPVGVSFYTFQAVGYTIDVYKGKINAERDFLTYSLFIAFFPLLVAGPIERATNMLPQFHVKHKFKYENAVEGVKLMIWGFFMKLCVGDVLCEYVDAVYNNIPEHGGASLILASLFFTFQIYCDFGGYSNIAIGAAKIMGYNAMENFHRPYFANSTKTFWQRWHISLSSWFADYVYIPLGGNRVKYVRHLFNLMVTFIVSGIWHGANWTFVLWGALHGTYRILENCFNKFIYKIKYDAWYSKLIGTVLCFVAVAFAWIFFRANSINDAFAIIYKMTTDSSPLYTDMSVFAHGMLGLGILIYKDLKDEFGWKMNFMHSRYAFIRYASVIALISYILLFGSFSGGQFIYFQF